MQRKCLLIATAIFLCSPMFHPAELPAAPYYEGKIVTLLVGTEPGGGTDRLGRLIAKYIPRFIPGKPTVIIKNMSGAGGLVPANYIYSASKPDGLTFGTFNRGIILSQLLQVKGTKFDMTKYSWVGSGAMESTLLAIRSDLPYKTYEDLKKAKEPLIMGTQVPGRSSTRPRPCCCRPRRAAARSPRASPPPTCARCAPPTRACRSSPTSTPTPT